VAVLPGALVSERASKTREGGRGNNCNGQLRLMNRGKRGCRGESFPACLEGARARAGLRRGGGNASDGRGASGRGSCLLLHDKKGRQRRPRQQQHRRPVRVRVLGGTGLVESMRPPGRLVPEPGALLREPRVRVRSAASRAAAGAAARGAAGADGGRQRRAAGPTAAAARPGPGAAVVRGARRVQHRDHAGRELVQGARGAARRDCRCCFERRGRGGMRRRRRRGHGARSAPRSAPPARRRAPRRVRGRAFGAEPALLLVICVHGREGGLRLISSDWFPFGVVVPVVLPFNWSPFCRCRRSLGEGLPVLRHSRLDEVTSSCAEHSKGTKTNSKEKCGGDDEGRPTRRGALPLLLVCLSAATGPWRAIGATIGATRASPSSSTRAWPSIRCGTGSTARDLRAWA